MIIKKVIRKIKNQMAYFYWSPRLDRLTDHRLRIPYILTKFDNNHRLKLWYIAGKRHGYSDAIHYAFFKAYHFWGTDSLNEEEAKGF